MSGSAIGTFTIGISPVGGPLPPIIDNSETGSLAPLPLAAYLNLITPQHSIQPKFMATVAALVQPMVDAQALFGTMPTLFDLDTATGVQLDQIGLWIGRTRRITVPIIGFFSWNTTGLGWNQSIWHAPFVPLTENVYLDDSTYRNLLRAKVILNRWDGSMAMLYEVLGALFDGFPHTHYVITDNLDMTMTITLSGTQPTNTLLSIIRTGVLPLAPLGVSITISDPW